MFNYININFRRSFVVWLSCLGLLSACISDEIAEKQPTSSVAENTESSDRLSTARNRNKSNSNLGIIPYTNPYYKIGEKHIVIYLFELDPLTSAHRKQLSDYIQDRFKKAFNPNIVLVYVNNNSFPKHIAAFKKYYSEANIPKPDGSGYYDGTIFNNTINNYLKNNYKSLDPENAHRFYVFLDDTHPKHGGKGGSAKQRFKFAFVAIRDFSKSFVRFITTHEIGHLLGAIHTDWSLDIMFLFTHPSITFEDHSYFLNKENNIEMKAEYNRVAFTITINSEYISPSIIRPDKTYILVNVATERALATKRAPSKNPTIIVKDWTKSPTEKWQFQRNRDGTYLIKRTGTRNVITLMTIAEPAFLQLFGIPPADASNETHFPNKWKIRFVHRSDGKNVVIIQNLDNNKVISQTSTDWHEYNSVQLEPYSSNARQQWYIKRFDLNNGSNSL